MGPSTPRDAIRMLREMDKTIADTAARLEHCRALIRESDRLLETLRGLQSPPLESTDIDDH
ncbi:hypothetical protein [Occallatibacter savannae]|uniref:hypothetical protein n=1 Tax=Occallatibacter savannae TaxID=1002691 RepID=UPI00194F4161|nr:hypothetical protein [Occallatibacter savannae]